jgi:hypothetical protein
LVLVVVDDLDVMCVAITPDEADAKSIVHADAVPTSSVAAQRFESVSGKHRQILKFVGRMHLAELPLSDVGYSLKAAGRPPVEEPLGFFRPERPDHCLEGYNASRDMSSGIAARPEPFTAPSRCVGRSADRP